jgi:hypothetical protein
LGWKHFKEVPTCSKTWKCFKGLGDK